MGCKDFNNSNLDECGVVKGYKIGGLISAYPFSFTKAELDDEVAVKTKIVASEGRIIPIILPDYYELVNQSEPITQETTSGITETLGETGHSFKVSKASPDWYAIQKSLMDGAQKANCYLLTITSNGFYEGNETIDGLSVEARKYQVYKGLMIEEGRETQEMLGFTFTELQPVLNKDRMWYGKPDTYFPPNLKGINDVTVEQKVADATSPVFTITKNGRAGSVPTQLAVANFIVLDNAGNTQAVSGVAYANGDWTVTADTTFVDGTIQVIALVDDAVYYESVPTAFTVS